MKKSNPGYIRQYRKINLIWLLVWVLIGVGIFTTGWLIWHTRANILTVLAVLSVLPGAKRIVALIAAGRKKSVSLERCRQVETAVENYIYAGDLDLHEFEPDEEAEEDTPAAEEEAQAPAEEGAEATAEETQVPAAEGAEATAEETQAPAAEGAEATAEETQAPAEEVAVKPPRRGRSPYEEPEIPWNVIFTDYIFTSTEKIMMLDFMVVMGGTIFILPSSTNQDQDYVKKYLTDGIQKWSTVFDIRFVWDDEKLLAGLKDLQESKVVARERREVLEYLKSLAM
ncbi:MAG: hypothetical protein VZQ83_05220 [Eubacterium sp.]|nr:hypothetical protein [Eubacterium sp.]